MLHSLRVAVVWARLVSLLLLLLSSGSGSGLQSILVAAALATVLCAAAAAAAAAPGLVLVLALTMLCLSSLTVAGPFQPLAHSHLLLFWPESSWPYQSGPSPTVHRPCGEHPTSSPCPPSTSACLAIVSLQMLRVPLGILPSCQLFGTAVSPCVPAATSFFPFRFSSLQVRLMTLGSHFSVFFHSYSAPTADLEP